MSAFYSNGPLVIFAPRTNVMHAHLSGDGGGEKAGVSLAHNKTMKTAIVNNEKKKFFNSFCKAR